MTTNRKPNEPALYLTAQATLPRLTTAMFAFSLAAIGFVAKSNIPDLSVPLLGFTFSTHQVAFLAFGMAVLAFHFATEGCVKSHAWDYHALSKDRRDSEGLSTDTEYVDHCRNHLRIWFRRTVWSYRIGFFAVMIGAAVLFLPFSWVTSCLIGLYAILAMLQWLRVALIRRSHVRAERKMAAQIAAQRGFGETDR